MHQWCIKRDKILESTKNFAEEAKLTKIRSSALINKISSEAFWFTKIQDLEEPDRRKKSKTITGRISLFGKKATGGSPDQRASIASTTPVRSGSKVKSMVKMEKGGAGLKSQEALPPSPSQAKKATNPSSSTSSSLQGRKASATVSNFSPSISPAPSAASSSLAEKKPTIKDRISVWETK